MKFIGIPKTVKKKNETIRSVLGAVLLVSLILVCILGAESLFTASRQRTVLTDESMPVTAADSANSLAAGAATIAPDSASETLISRSDDALIAAEVTAATLSPSPYATPAAGTPTQTPTIAATGTPAATPTTAVTFTSESVHYYVTADLTVRTGPGTNYDKVESLTAGDEVDSIAISSNGWVKLAEGQYVIDDYLSKTPPEEEYSGDFYAKGEINVRSGPGTEYPVTKTLPAGSGITVVARTSNGWYRTAVGSYVNADVCTSTPPATPTPKPTPKPTPTPTPAPGSLTELGSFKITFYGPTGYTTKTGTVPKEHQTIAVDPNVIPLGSTIYIENDPLGGNGYYIAEDTGSAVKGNIIDIFADDGESRSTISSVKVYLVNP